MHILKSMSLSPMVLPRIKLLFVTAVGLMTISCAAGQSVVLPPIAASQMDAVVEGQLVWIDLMTEDIAGAASFYSRLFEWRAARSRENSDYYLFYHNGRPVAGMVQADNQDRSKPESMWILSMSVKDLAQSLSTVKALKGTVLEGPTAVTGRGSMALISDTDGASIILLDTPGPGPGERSAGPGNWIWTDLFTRNREKAAAFYDNLAGFQTKRIEVGKTHTYDLFKRDGRPFAGLVELQWEGLEDNWLPYFKVADVERAIERARNLGGHLVVKKDNAAVLIDPSGAAFGIQM